MENKLMRLMEIDEFALAKEKHRQKLIAAAAGAGCPVDLLDGVDGVLIPLMAC